MKVLITGSNGLVGSSVSRILEDSSKVTELLPTNRNNLDLFDYSINYFSFLALYYNYLKHKIYNHYYNLIK